MIQNAGDQTLSIICNGNINNRRFFKIFDTMANKSWLITGEIFLLFDYVHLIKNIRINWLTEESSELNFHQKFHR